MRLEALKVSKEVEVSGRLGGAEIARTGAVYREGRRTAAHCVLTSTTTPHEAHAA